jgi:hypothetical protein
MAKIDRLGWAAGIAFRSYGIRLGVRTNQPPILERLDPLLPAERADLPLGPVDRLYSLFVPPARDPSARTRRYVLAYGDADLVGRSLSEDEALEGFGTDLQLFVAMMAKRRIFVHAGVVGWKGRAILLPGRSMAGKSTLVSALVAAGATYYSDEYAVLDERGRVHPYLSPLALRNGEGEPKTKIAAKALGSGPSLPPLTVGLVAHVRYKKDAHLRLRRVSAGQSLLLLLRNTVPARHRPDESFKALRQAVGATIGVNGLRGESHHMVASLLSLLDEEPPSDALSAQGKDRRNAGRGAP